MVDTGKLVSLIQKVFDKYKHYDEKIESITVRTDNFDNVITLDAVYKKSNKESEDDSLGRDLVLWIRLYRRSNETVDMDISSIQLTEKMSNKGLLQELTNSLAGLDEVGDLRITGVVTPEMQQWCEKRREHWLPDRFNNFLYTKTFKLCL